MVFLQRNNSCATLLSCHPPPMSSLRNIILPAQLHTSSRFCAAVFGGLRAMSSSAAWPLRREWFWLESCQGPSGNQRFECAHDRKIALCTKSPLQGRRGLMEACVYTHCVARQQSISCTETRGGSAWVFPRYAPFPGPCVASKTAQGGHFGPSGPGEPGLGNAVRSEGMSDGCVGCDARCESSAVTGGSSRGEGAVRACTPPPLPSEMYGTHPLRRVR